MEQGLPQPPPPLGSVVVDGQVLTEVDVSHLPPPPEDDDASLWTEGGEDPDERITDGPGDPDMLIEEEEGEEEGAGGGVDMAHTVFSEHSDYVYCASMHPLRPGVVVTGGVDDKAYLWSYDPAVVGSGAIVSSKELSGHTDTVTSVGFNFDGTLVLTGSYDGTVKVWDVASGDLVVQLEGPEDIEWASWHTKGNAVIAGSKDGTIWMWMTHNGQCVQVFAGHDGLVSAGCFSSDGKLVCSGGEDGTVRIWAPKTGACRHVFDGKLGHDAAVTCIASDEQDPELLATGSMDGTVKLFHLSNKRVLQTFVHCKPETVHDTPADGSEMEAEEEELESTMSVECVGVARGNLKWLASGGMDKTLKIWDTTNGSCRSVCVHAGGVVSLRWHASLPVVCTGCLDNLVRLWDARSGNMLAELSGHRDQVTFVDCLPPFTSSGDELDTIVTASNDGTARIFRVATLSLV